MVEAVLGQVLQGLGLVVTRATGQQVLGVAAHVVLEVAFVGGAVGAMGTGEGLRERRGLGLVGRVAPEDVPHQN